MNSHDRKTRGSRFYKKKIPKNDKRRFTVLVSLSHIRDSRLSLSKKQGKENCTISIDGFTFPSSLFPPQHEPRRRFHFPGGFYTLVSNLLPTISKLKTSPFFGKKITQTIFSCHNWFRKMKEIVSLHFPARIMITQLNVSISVPSVVNQVRHHRRTLVREIGVRARRRKGTVWVWSGDDSK